VYLVITLPQLKAKWPPRTLTAATERKICAIQPTHGCWWSALLAASAAAAQFLQLRQVSISGGGAVGCGNVPQVTLGMVRPLHLGEGSDDASA
jgi:hypothetical protein